MGIIPNIFSELKINKESTNGSWQTEILSSCKNSNLSALIKKNFTPKDVKSKRSLIGSPKQKKSYLLKRSQSKREIYESCHIFSDFFSGYTLLIFKRLWRSHQCRGPLGTFPRGEGSPRRYVPALGEAADSDLTPKERRHYLVSNTKTELNFIHKESALTCLKNNTVPRNKRPSWLLLGWSLRWIRLDFYLSLFKYQKLLFFLLQMNLRLMEVLLWFKDSQITPWLHLAMPILALLGSAINGIISNQLAWMLLS